MLYSAHLLFCNDSPPAAGLLAMSVDHDKCKLLLLLDHHLALNIQVASARVVSCADISLHTCTFTIPVCLTQIHFLFMMLWLLCLQATWLRLQARPSGLHLAITLTPTCPAPALPLPLHSAPVPCIRHQRRTHPCSSQLPAQPLFPPRELVLVLAQQQPVHRLWTQAFPPCA